MAGAQFRSANLQAADFSGANLEDARFAEAKLRGTDFRAANLRNAREMQADQLYQALTDNRTILPNGSSGPYIRRSGQERPASR
jgi:hypothetical protein